MNDLNFQYISRFATRQYVEREIVVKLKILKQIRILFNSCIWIGLNDYDYGLCNTKYWLLIFSFNDLNNLINEKCVVSKKKKVSICFQCYDFCDN